MNLAEPTNNFQFVVYVVGAVIVLAPSAFYLVYLKFGNKKGSKDVPCISREERAAISRYGELLNTDNQRIKALETGHSQLWQLITTAGTERREFAEKVIGEIGEIKGELKVRNK